ncbi:DNA-3-methyladenine glycosylase family protein [Leptolyngbya sp. 7M]|uniref:DNA-3-methyladenine glycosylase family protein n=1 Tax=Leptolyngbya sp. 7M TaxID=2812896 RepID=UPI001B8CB467|nr:hypothetical protein [Leptolyngbya sp. 7M]QYO65732.1 hypothetical protein JVX88_02770 [Leptolyngbya sp. 7M]
MQQRVSIATPSSFSFRHTVNSHGWSDLLPFEVDPELNELIVSLDLGNNVVTARITHSGGRLKIKLTEPVAQTEQVRKTVAHIFRLDEPLDEFYILTAADPELMWVSGCGAGRLLRSSTVWEDLVKTLCTTNCSWSLTRIMVTNIVNELGPAGSDGRRAFPSAEMMADKDEAFYRDVIRAGYRAPYLHELANSVACGKLKPDEFLDPQVPSAELRANIKKIKGFGDYATDNLLKLLGRYDGLALDSWLRSRFYEKRNNGRRCPDKKIERHYKKYGDWKGLAIWCDMTEDWFAEPE